LSELTCIVCPIGCSLSIRENADGSLAVSGNRCPRGVAYAVEELRSPKRMVTATCRLVSAVACGDDGSLPEPPGRQGLCDPRRVPVRSSAPCPKERVPDLLAAIYAKTVQVPIKCGDLVIENWMGTGIDVVASRSLE
jgi:CxxC motif-containing protein